MSLASLSTGVAPGDDGIFSTRTFPVARVALFAAFTESSFVLGRRDGSRTPVRVAIGGAALSAYFGEPPPAHRDER